MKKFKWFNHLIIAAIAIIFVMANPVQALAEEAFEILPDAGDKCPIGEDYYFIYNFDKKPQLGTVILKVELFNKEGQRVTDLKITGDSGMPGDWEVKLKFFKGEEVVYRGSIRFDI